VFLSSLHYYCNHSLKRCKNPNHKVYVANFVKKYPSIKVRVPKTIVLVAPQDWAVDLEHPSKNTTECCQICIVAESIARDEKWIGVTGPGQSCTCQWKVRC
jgi:hypothetical protein